MRVLLKVLWTSVLLVGITLGQASVNEGWIMNKVDAAQPMSDYAVHPTKDAIVFGLQKGYIWKYPDGKFYPDHSIVQSQFVASLVAIRGVKEKAPMTELPEGHWAKEIYERAKKAGILADVKIDPNKQLTKEEAAKLVFNTWKPFRGEKNPNLTNTGALITWGWMKPAPNGQPKFREDLPMLRGDAADILRFLWQDKWQLELGAKYADEFHKSLKIVNGKIVGKVPKGDGNFMITAMFVTKQNGREGFLNNETFSVPLINVVSLTFGVINSKDSSDAGVFWYTKLPNLERSNQTQGFYLSRGAQ